MKKTLLLAAIALTTQSCKKCWECRQTYNVDKGAVIPYSVCDKTRSEIKAMEKQGTISYHDPAFGTITRTMTCK